jgi:hypothetical protein
MFIVSPLLMGLKINVAFLWYQFMATSQVL